MIPHDLPRRSGIAPSALLGDIHLLLNEPESARDAYRIAWSRGDLSSLIALAIIDPHRDLQSYVSDVARHLRSQRISRDDGIETIRLLAAMTAFERSEPTRAVSLVAAALTILPEISFPLAWLREAPVSQSAWEQTLQSIRTRAAETRDPASVRELSIRSHYISAALLGGHGDAGGCRLLHTRQRDGGTEIYLALRLADRMSVGPRRDQPDIQDTMEVAHHEVPAEDPDLIQLGQALTLLVDLIEDEEARAVYGLRLAACRMALGDHDSAIQTLESLDSSNASVSHVALERLQRLHVDRRAWREASKIADGRADRTSQPELASALRLLALEYLAAADAPRTARQAVSRKLLAPTHGDTGIMRSPRRHGFEVLEGCLIEADDLDELERLWRQIGAVSRRAGPQRAELATGVPDRTVEWTILMRGRHEPNDDKWVESSPLLRRYLVVRALASGDPRRAQRLTQQGPSSMQGLEPALGVALALDSVGDVGGASGSLATAVDRLEREIRSTTRIMDLLPAHLFRVACQVLGRSDRSAELLAEASERACRQQRALLLALAAKDFIAMGRQDDALRCARDGFAAAPLESAVRIIYRQAATLCGSRADSDALLSVTDNQSLLDLLSTSGEDGRLRSALEDRDAPQQAVRVAALATVEELITEAIGGRIRGGLARLASEIAWERLNDAERSQRWADVALEAAPDDLLVVRQAATIAVSTGHFSAACDLLSGAPVRPPLPQTLGEEFAKGAAAAQLRGDFALAYQLALLGLDAIGPRTPSDLILSSLSLGESLAVAQGSIQSWLDGLVRWRRCAGPDLGSVLDRRAAGILTRHLGDDARARVLYERALRHTTDPLPILEALVDLCETEGDLEALSRTLGQLVAAYEKHTTGQRGTSQQDALERYAELLQQLGQPTQACDMLERLARLRPSDPSILLKVAGIERGEGHFTAAIAALERAASATESPRDRAGIHLQMGEIYAGDLGDTKLAAERTMAAFICDPSSDTTLAKLEQVCLATGRSSELTRAYELALDALRDTPGASQRIEDLLVKKADLHWRQGQGTLAAAALVGALNQNPLSDDHLEQLETIAVHQRINEELAQGYRLAIEATTGETRSDLLQRLANLLLTGGDLDAAERVLRELLTTWPGDSRAEDQLAKIYRQTGRHGDLRVLFETRINRWRGQDKAVGPLLELAELAEKSLHDLDLAIRCHEDLFEFGFGTPASISAHCRLLEADRQWERLLEVSEAEAELVSDPIERAAVFFRIGSIRETRTADLDGALRAYLQAVELDPASIPAMHGAREIYRGRRRWDAVVRSLETEARLWDKPRESASVLVSAALIQWHELDAIETAEATLRRALSLSPHQPGAMTALIEVLGAQGRWEAAEAYAGELAESRLSGAPIARSESVRLQALTARMLGNLAGAWTLARTALELDPNSLRAIDEVLAVARAAADQEGADTHGLDRVLEALGSHRTLAGDLDRQRLTLALRADLAEADGDLDAAEGLHRQSIELAPLHAASYAPLTEFLKRWRRFRDAEAALLDAVDRLRAQLRFPDNAAVDKAELATLHLELGGLSMNWLGAPDRGIADYDKAVVLKPSSVRGLICGAQCALLLGSWEQALGRLRRAQSQLAKADRFLALLLEGTVLSRGYNDTDGALERWRLAISADPRDVRPVIASIRALAACGRFNDIDPIYRSALERLDARGARAQLQLVWARSLVVRGEPGRAKAVFTALAESGADADPRITLMAAQHLRNLESSNEKTTQ